MYNGLRHSSRHLVSIKDKDKIRPLPYLFLMMRCQVTFVQTSFSNGLESPKYRSFFVLIGLV